MDQERKLPKFESEAEEARWWFENQDRIAADFEKAAAEGKLGHGSAARMANAASAAVRLDSEDVELARRQATSHGMEYQSYLKMIVHRALAMEEKSA